MLDLILAILHHLIVFSLVAVMFAEIVTVRRGMDAAAVARVAAIDVGYGILAGLIVFVGFGYLKWRKAGAAPANEVVAKVRRLLLIEMVLFAPLLAFAAAMARGYGSF
jgi:putative membrane protein